jgi:hypothetical protein
MPRYFTRDEAEKLMRAIVPEVRQMIHIGQEHRQAEEQLEAVSARVAMLGGVMVNRDKLVALRSRRDALILRLKETVETLHGYGCQIKDHRSGLVDFPTLYRGEEVYLCWKFGEERIAFWHGEEGFRGRREIDREFLENHRGDAQ